MVYESVNVGRFALEGKDTAGAIAISIGTVPQRWAKGAPPFLFEVRYRGAPEGAAVVVWLYRDVAQPALRSPVRGMPDTGGALSAEAVPVKGDGTLTVKFDGTAWGTPADYPVNLEADRGRYVFVVQMRRDREPVIGMMAPNPPPILVQTKSDPFIIDGAQSASSRREFRSAFRRAFEDKLAEGFDLYAPGSGLQRYYTLGLVEVGEEGICADIEMALPFNGKFHACIPAAFDTEAGLIIPHKEDFSYSGRIGFSQGILSYRKARAAAALAIKQKLTDSAKHETRIVTTNWSYNLDDQHWRFVVRALPSSSNEEYAVRVSDAGEASIALELGDRRPSSWAVEYDRQRPDPNTE
jgi:hypothetical protein